MGKYIKKSKLTGDVSVMEVSPQSLGVRTRAKTLAQLNLQTSPSNPDVSSFSYLQLRSRRLEKTFPLSRAAAPPKRQQLQTCREQSRDPNPSSRDSSSVGSVSQNHVNGKTEEVNYEGIEASFEENNLDFEGRGRNTRESTPCSSIRDSEIFGNPGSTTRWTCSTVANQRIQGDVQRNMATSLEMDEFFACGEQQQQRLFIEKYNFDIVNDMPLPGRYEWVQLFP